MSKETILHVVADGEHLAGIAFSYGVAPADIWDSPDNASIKALRKNGHILAPGDVLVVPKVKRKWLPVTTGGVTNLTAKVPVVNVGTTFHDAAGPIKGEPFVVHCRNPVHGSTDAKGKAVFDVAVFEKVVAVEFPARGLRVFLHVGDLDPLTTVSGVRQRLRNLGHYPHHGRDEDVDPVTLATAVADFQQAKGLKVTGEIDDDVRQALESTHGA